jgi:hypothetical protein
MIRCVHLLQLVALAASACVTADDDVDTTAGDLAIAPSCPPDDACIPGRLLDTSPAPGVQPECAVTVLFADDLEYAVPPCTLTGGAPPCFQPVLDRDACPATPTGLRMDVLHDWDDVVDIDVQCVRSRR